jgi:hypothetical protein
VSAWRAVTPAMGKPAPSAAETSAGLATVSFSLDTANSASPPPYCQYTTRIERTKKYMLY